MNSAYYLHIEFDAEIDWHVLIMGITVSLPLRLHANAHHNLTYLSILLSACGCGSIDTRSGILSWYGSFHTVLISYPHPPPRAAEAVWAHNPQVTGLKLGFDTNWRRFGSISGDGTGLLDLGRIPMRTNSADGNWPNSSRNSTPMSALPFKRNIKPNIPILLNNHELLS